MEKVIVTRLKENIEIGELGEVSFAVESVKRGFKLSKPLSNYPYDYILDNGKNLLKIQVKCVNYYNKSLYGYSISSKRISKTNKSFYYRENDMDFIAAYIVPENLWYIVPYKNIAHTKGIAVFPNTKDSKGKYEKFKNAWELLND